MLHPFLQQRLQITAFATICCKRKNENGLPAASTAIGNAFPETKYPIKQEAATTGYKP